MLALVGTAKKKKKVFVDLAREENSSWSNITDISQSALWADWYPDSKSGFSKLCVSTSHSHHPETMSVCMWLKQTYQEGCAVCSRAHPRRKLFAHKDTPQTANPSSQIPISHENLTHGLGLCLSIFFDWQMKFLRKTSVIQNHLILEPYQTNMRKNVWACVHVVCVCVCVCGRHTELELSAQYSSQLMKALHSLLILRENIVVIHFVSGLLKTGITGETPELFLISLYQNSFWKDKIFPPLSPWPQINPWTIPEREREKGEMRYIECWSHAPHC